MLLLTAQTLSIPVNKQMSSFYNLFLNLQNGGGRAAQKKSSQLFNMGKAGPDRTSKISKVAACMLPFEHNAANLYWRTQIASDWPLKPVLKNSQQGMTGFAVIGN